MTGFGRGVARTAEAEVAAEVRCANSRHLEVRVRLPRELAPLEDRVRRLAAGFFARGSAEVGVRLARAPRRGGVEVDVEAAGEYARAARELAARLDADPGLDVPALLALPGVARQTEAEPDPGELEAPALEAVEAACAGAREMRRREGEALEADLRDRLEGVARGLERIEARASEVPGARRERLRKRLRALAPEIEVDPARLEQEVLLHVERADTSEESVRLRSHCEQFRESLASEAPVGRKLEFLLQEIGREINTVGSKAPDAEVAREVVEVKAALEKIREQVLNVE